MRKRFSMPAYLEVCTDDGNATFHPTESVLASPKLQERLVDKPSFRGLLRDMRRAGRLIEDPLQIVSMFSKTFH
jgi:hypothetical protein